jgi:hypothetical protein
MPHGAQCSISSCDAESAQPREAGVRGQLKSSWRANQRSVHWRLARADFVVCGPLTLLGWERVKRDVCIGEGVALESPCLAAPLQIGDRVHAGQDVMILTGTHYIVLPGRRCGANDFKPVSIGDGVWRGVRATVLPGVSAGAGAVISAGSVVTRDVPSLAIASGNPARVRKQFGTLEELVAYMNSRQPERRG